MVKSSNLSWIVVSDIAKARKFFSDVVGMREDNYDEKYKWAEFVGTDGGARLGVAGEGSEIGPGSNAIMTFTVDDIEKTREEFSKKGVELHGEIMEVPGHVKLQMFSDADGNKFQIVEML